MSLFKQFFQKFCGQENCDCVEVSDSVAKFDGVNPHSLVVYAPKDLQELNKVIDCVLGGQAVIINLGAIRKKDYQTFADYLSGAIYVMRANVFHLEEQLFVIAPKSVKIATL